MGLTGKLTVLVHGAENFVGRRLVAFLKETDWAEPWAVGTLDPALARAAGSATSVVQLVSGNLATIERGTAELYAVVARRPDRPRVVHVSSMTVYGSVGGEVAEHSELRADLGSYARAQCAAEQAASRHENVVVLRPGGEYGPGCPYWTLQVARLLLSGRLGDLGPAGEGRCNLLYIDDLVQAIALALRTAGLGGGVFNLGLPAPPTWNRYFLEFAGALHALPVRRISRFRLNAEVGLLAPVLRLGNLALKLTGVRNHALPPPITSAMTALYRQHIRLNVDRAEQILGVKWTDLGRGLERAAAWCHESSAGGVQD